jgi:hypothetical protein
VRRGREQATGDGEPTEMTLETADRADASAVEATGAI